jgi:hypothetical protein
MLITVSDYTYSSGDVSVVAHFVKQAECEKVRMEIQSLDLRRNGFGRSTGETHHRSRCVQAEVVVVK